jgi:hypothetical protein
MTTLSRRLGLPMIAVAALVPALAGSEGAVRILDCSIEQVCNAAGNCRPGSGLVTFRTEPVSLRADGSGTYALSYGDVEAEMEAQSPAGPFFWTVGNERDTLLASSETQFLWHQLTFELVPEATIRFLQCAFRQ